MNPMALIPTCCSKATRTQPINRSSAGIFRLPTDLLHEITLFLTKEFEGLYRIRMICKEWKAVAESSMIWFYCPLIFYCPKDYLRPLLNEDTFQWDTIASLYRSLRLKQLRNNLKSLDLFEDFHTSTLNECWVKCDARNARLASSTTPSPSLIPPPPPSPLQPPATIAAALNNPTISTSILPLLTNSSSNISPVPPPSSSSFPQSYQTMMGEPSSSSSMMTSTTIIPKQNRFQESEKIFQWFHHVHRSYQTRWRNRMIYDARICLVDDWMANNFGKMMICELVFSLALVVLSLYGWYTLDQNIAQHRMSWENYLSFLCLYCICFMHMMVTILDVVNQLCHRFRKSSSFTLAFWDYTYFFGNDCITIAFFCVIVFLLLVQVILIQKATQSSSILPWRITLIPVWFCVLSSICLITLGMTRYSKIYHLKNDRTIGALASLVIMISAASSITLFAIFYDQLWIVQYPAGYALFPLFPLLIGFLVIAIFQIIAIIGRIIWDVDVFLMDRKVDTRFRFWLNIGSMISLIVIVVMMLLLCVDAFKGRSVLGSLSPIFQLALFGFGLHSWIACEMILFNERLIN